MNWYLVIIKTSRGSWYELRCQFENQVTAVKEAEKLMKEQFPTVRIKSLESFEMCVWEVSTVPDHLRNPHKVESLPIKKLKKRRGLIICPHCDLFIKEWDVFEDFDCKKDAPSEQEVADAKS